MSTIRKAKDGRPRFREYSCVLREVTPGEFVIVSFAHIQGGNLPASPLLRGKEILTRKP